MYNMQNLFNFMYFTWIFNNTIRFLFIFLCHIAHIRLNIRKKGFKWEGEPLLVIQTQSCHKFIKNHFAKIPLYITKNVSYNRICFSHIYKKRDYS